MDNYHKSSYCEYHPHFVTASRAGDKIRCSCCVVRLYIIWSMLITTYRILFYDWFDSKPIHSVKCQHRLRRSQTDTSLHSVFHVRSDFFQRKIRKHSAYFNRISLYRMTSTLILRCFASDFYRRHPTLRNASKTESSLSQTRLYQSSGNLTVHKGVKSVGGSTKTVSREEGCRKVGSKKGTSTKGASRKCWCYNAEPRNVVHSLADLAGLPVIRKMSG